MFLGLLRTVVYIVGVWFIWRWLDGWWPSECRVLAEPATSAIQGRPCRRLKEGEYIDFEEVKD